MDVATITQIITNLGFPIVCCGALFWKMNKQDENHKQEIDGMTKAIENNNLVLNRLCDKMDSVEHSISQ